MAVSVVLAATFLLLSASWVALSYRYVPDMVPFWYSLPWGEGRLAPRRALFYLIAAVAAVGFGNMILARFLRTSPLITYSLTIATVVLAVLTSITVVQITRLWLP